jgi:putative redox protein
MKATARRDDRGGFRHTVQVRDHQLSVDEPLHVGGQDAARKGWDIGHVEVAVEYSPAERGCPTKFELVMRLPDDLPDDQAERLRVIAAKCPVHRALDGEVMFMERVERVHLAA